MCEVLRAECGSHQVVVERRAHLQGFSLREPLPIQKKTMGHRSSVSNPSHLLHLPFVRLATSLAWRQVSSARSGGSLRLTVSDLRCTERTLVRQAIQCQTTGETAEWLLTVSRSASTRNSAADVQGPKREGIIMRRRCRRHLVDRGSSVTCYDLASQAGLIGQPETRPGIVTAPSASICRGFGSVEAWRLSLIPGPLVRDRLSRWISITGLCVRAAAGTLQPPPAEPAWPVIDQRPLGCCVDHPSAVERLLRKSLQVGAIHCRLVKCR